MTVAPELFLSIDFEDRAHDMKRELGLWETGPLRVDALWRSYETIDAFFTRHGARATFFCTGVIADQAPDLIARIAADGHEVGCHYHFHDALDRQDARTVDANLARAKAALEEAANSMVIGFRAPMFRISTQDPAQYRLVERHFTYDSSCIAGSLAEVEAFKRRMGLSELILLPIFAGRPHPRLPRMKLGGSYLKLFPHGVTERVITAAAAAGMDPHIYLHPYEFMTGGEFLLSRADLAPLGVKKAAYWQLRQHQWNTVGNAGMARKLAALTEGRRLRGRLRDHLH